MSLNNEVMEALPEFLKNITNQHCHSIVQQKSGVSSYIYNKLNPNAPTRVEFLLRVLLGTGVLFRVVCTVAFHSV